MPCKNGVRHELTAEIKETSNYCPSANRLCEERTKLFHLPVLVCKLKATTPTHLLDRAMDNQSMFWQHVKHRVWNPGSAEASGAYNVDFNSVNILSPICYKNDGYYYLKGLW